MLCKSSRQTTDTVNVLVWGSISQFIIYITQEANNMVQDANIKRMHSEKLLIEAHQQVSKISCLLCIFKINQLISVILY